MSECTHDCSSCSQNCSSREKTSFLIPAHEKSSVKHVIGVVSGKGGVGKSLVTSMLAVLLQRKGYRVGILDADITGPSIPKAFGMRDAEVFGDETGMLPPASETGIQVMSVNLMLGDETKPVVWRGSIISNTVQQFWKDTVWDAEILLVDCPPGTGDVPLTVFQTMPLDGIVIVSSPQELVSMIVSKAANMADMMNIPVLGLVENMSYVKCPDCGKEIRVFGDSHIEEIAASFGYDLLARLPMDPQISAHVDAGLIEKLDVEYLDQAAETILSKIQEKKA
ncbi:MAG: Mrp/NBP35 family ATP-binding protein [Ruminococcaceae bacterium]|nr:Mrp/NBP35 family ATP-binding protein [Oscillospiraceae bacterium]